VKSVPSSKSKPVPLEQFIGNLKENLLEKILFCSTSSPSVDSIDSADVPPIIAPALRGAEIFNTEMEKKSIYLTQKAITSKTG
jgi:hypothetical protein